MSNQIFSLQESVKNLRQEINDILHVAYLNKQSIMCLVQENKGSPFKQIQLNKMEKESKGVKKSMEGNRDFIMKLKHEQFQKKFNDIAKVFQKRCENHLNFLIVNQIKWEEQSVRRERLVEYQDRIYDQRRLISDKQVFLENLLRPKKKRPETMSNQDFLEMRSSQKALQEVAKASRLQDQTKMITKFRRNCLQFNNKINRSLSDLEVMRRQKELYKKSKQSLDLQKTKANSLEIVNNVSATQNNVTIGDKGSKNNISQQAEALPVEQKKPPISTHLSGNFSKIFSKHFQQTSLTDEKKQQKFTKIVKLLQKISIKKEQNASKIKQLKQLQIQNNHMKDHLKKQKEIYQKKMGQKQKGRQ